MYRSDSLDMDAFVAAAVIAADKLCSAVLQGAPGQQKLALDYARALDSAKRAGYDPTYVATCTGAH